MMKPVVARSVRLTGPGIAALGMGLALTATLIFLARPVPFHLGVAILLCLAAALALTPRRLLPVHGRWLLPGAIHACGDITVGAALNAESGCSPVSLEAFDPATGTITTVVELPGLGRASTRVAWVLRFPRRGRLVLPGLRAVNQQPFGLIRASRIISDPEEVLVLPAIGRLARDFEIRLQHWLEHGPVSDAPGDDEISHLRAYRTGDPMHHVHWRATARYRQVLVAQRHAPASRRVALILDLRALGRGHKPLERLIAVAATLVDHLCRNGWVVSLHGHAFAEAGIESDRRTLLEHLAFVKLDRADPPAPSAPERLNALLLTVQTDLPAPHPRCLVLDLAEAERRIQLPRVVA